MANKTITNPNGSYSGMIAGVQFANGTATADDTTAAGKALIAFAQRHGWANGSNAAVPILVQNGKPVARWTKAELSAYLDAFGVKYPSSASAADLLAAVQTAYETRAQGGSAALEAAGHIMGTFPVLDAPNVNGDDEAEAALWSPPVISPAGDGDTAAPTITTQPTDQSKVVGTPAVFTVAVSGAPAPSIQWECNAPGDPAEFVEIEGGEDGTLEVPTTNVNQTGAQYRATIRNPEGEAISNVATLTVTAS